MGLFVNKYQIPKQLKIAVVTINETINMYIFV